MQTDSEVYIVQAVKEGANIKQATTGANKKRFVTETPATGWDNAVKVAEQTHAYANPDRVVVSTHKLQNGQVVFTDWHYNQRISILQLSNILKRTKYVFFYNLKTNDWDGRSLPVLDWRSYAASPRAVRWAVKFLLTITGIRLYNYLMLQLAMFLTGIIDHCRKNGMI